MLLRRKMFKKRNFRRRRRIVLLVVFVSILSLALYLDSTIQGIVEGLVIKNAQGLIQDAVNQTVEETQKQLNISYDNLVLSDGNEKSAASLQVNAPVVNSMKTAVIHTVSKKLYTYRNLETTFQIGSITGSAILSNHGPDIPIYCDFYSFVNAEIVSKFSGAGLNQTVHRVMLTVTTKYCLMIINDRYEDSVTSDYCLGESVIVGEVPNSYGSLYGVDTDTN